MQTHGFLQYAVVLLLATVIAVPLAKRWQLGAVLGYLAAGALIGPSGIRLIGNTEEISQISELGVVLMLFVIGMELSPQRLWVMRRTVFGLGSLQLVATALAIGGIAFWLGLDWKGALIVGLGLALSSTAIDLQILSERKEIATAHGRLGFAILLFQDVAAIPILALIPVLGTAQAASTPAAEVFAALRVIVTIALVVVGGRYLLRPMFRAAARGGAPEVFTATALLVVIGTAWLMELAGLSMSLGAFLAGVLLADSEYRHEIEAQIEPFRGPAARPFFRQRRHVARCRARHARAAAGRRAARRAARREGDRVVRDLSRRGARGQFAVDRARGSARARRRVRVRRVHAVGVERPDRSGRARPSDADHHAVDGRDAALWCACAPSSRRLRKNRNRCANSIASTAPRRA